MFNTDNQLWIFFFLPDLGGLKTDPLEKPSDHPQAELGLSHMGPELGSNPQRWDDERFRALKVSSLNYLAMGAAANCESLLFLL